MKRLRLFVPAVLAGGGLCLLTSAAFLIALPLGLAVAGASLILAAITIGGA